MNAALPRLALGAALAVVVSVPAAVGADRIEKKLALDPGGRIVVEIDAGAVSVTGSSEPGVMVVVTSKTPDLEDRWALTFEETPGQVRIAAKRKRSGSEGSWSSGWLSGWFGGRSTSSAPRFEIRVPRKTQVSVDTAGGSIDLASVEGVAKLQTAGGSIKLSGVEGDATASTAGGSIDVADLAGNLVAETAGGSVRVADVSGDARVETAGGSILLDRIGGRVDAETAGGSIEAGLLPGNSRGGRLATMGGGIRLRLDSAANLVLDASSGGGSVSTDLQLTNVARKSRSSLEGTLGSGGEKLVVETAGGSVRIEGLGGTR